MSEPNPRIAELVEALTLHWDALPEPLQARLKGWCESPESILYALLRMVRRHYASTRNSKHRCAYCVWWEAFQLVLRLDASAPPLDTHTQGGLEYARDRESFDALMHELKRALRGGGLAYDEPA